MIGIIYKFTVVAKYKIDGCKPFYVGQHMEKISVEYFASTSLKNSSFRYYGSGVIWNKILNKIKSEYPEKWRCFIKREILYAKEGISQKALNVLEEHFIKNEMAHYSFGIGGCNILWNSLDAISMDAQTRKKISESHKGDKNPIYKHVFTEEERKRISKRNKGVCRITEAGRKSISENMKNRVVSDKTKKKISESLSGDKNPNFGKRGCETSMYGKHHSEETKRKMSERMRGKNNPMYGVVSPNRGKKMSEEQKKKISIALKGNVLLKNRKILRGVEHPAYGKHLSEAVKIKIGNGNRGKKVSEETREKMRKAALLREERKKLIYE